MRRAQLSAIARGQAVLSIRELQNLARIVRSLERSGNRQGMRDSTGIHQRLGLAIAPVVRLGQIKEIHQVTGPPSAHLYGGIFADDEDEKWGGYTGTNGTVNVDGLQELTDNCPNVVYSPMEIDDYVLVVFNPDETAIGILGGETPDFIVCECG